MIIQDDLGRATPVTGNPSRPASRNDFDEGIEAIGYAEDELANLRLDLKSEGALRPGANVQGSSAVQTIGPISNFVNCAAILPLHKKSRDISFQEFKNGAETCQKAVIEKQRLHDSIHC